MPTQNNHWFSKIQNPLAREWFRLAEEDFKYANDTFKETENYRMICFICQQVAERYLKGFLQSHNMKFPKIHDLPELLDLSVKKDKGFSDFIRHCEILTNYYIDTRYPAGIGGEIFSKKIAEEALNLTREIIDFIKDKFNN